MHARLPGWTFNILLAGLAVGAMIILFISTPAGAGLANDSVAYIAGARSILHGTGYSDIWLDSALEPITHYPPLLSLSLSALGLLGVDPLRGARILNILFFGANTVLMGLLGWRISRSRAAGLWAAALFMLNASLLRVHVFALSEPLFLFLSLMAFIFADIYAGDHKKMIWLLLAGLASGLAFLTRYSALALLPVFILAFLLLQSSPDPNLQQNGKAGFGFSGWQSRLCACGIYLAGAIPLMAAWFVHNQLTAGNTTNRTFQFHMPGPENIQPGFYNFSVFLVPVETWRQALMKSGLIEWILAAAGLGLVAWLIMATWNSLSRARNGTPRFLTFTTIIYIFGYLGAVLFSMSFFDASTKFQPRILAPVYVSAMLLVVTFGSWLWKKASQAGHAAMSTSHIIVIMMAVATLVFSTYGTTRAIEELKNAGQGYASWKWHDSLVMASLKNLSPDIAIYTNTPPAVYLVTGRASRTLPTPVDPVDNLARTDYEQNLAEMRSDLMNGKAVLALFDTSALDDSSSMQDVTRMTGGLKVLQKVQGDILYGKP